LLLSRIAKALELRNESETPLSVSAGEPPVIGRIHASPRGFGKTWAVAGVVCPGDRKKNAVVAEVCDEHIRHVVTLEFNPAPERADVVAKMKRPRGAVAGENRLFHASSLRRKERDRRLHEATVPPKGEPPR
jgi:hypothetical protein